MQVNRRGERGYSCSLSHSQSISLPPVGQPGRPGVFSGSASQLGPCPSGAGGWPGALGPPTGSRACDVMRRWEGRIKGWAVASHENHSAHECCDSQTQVLPPASTQGSFRMWWVFQAPGNAGDNQQGSGGGLGPRSLLRGGLSGSPVQPWSAGSWHPSSPGRSWGCPLPTGRDTGAQEGGDLRRAP